MNLYISTYSKSIFSHTPFSLSNENYLMTNPSSPLPLTNYKTIGTESDLCCGFLAKIATI